MGFVVAFVTKGRHSLPSTDNEGALEYWTRDEMLAFVRRGAARRRRRTRTLVGIATTVSLAIFVRLASVTSGGGRPATVAAGSVSTVPPNSAQSPSTISGPTSSTSAETSFTGGGNATPAPTTAGPATSTQAVAPPPTTTAGNCRNSIDPACGPPYWDPDPGANQPLTIVVESQHLGGPKNRTLSLKVTLDDPDAGVRENCRTVKWGDGQIESPKCPAETLGCLVRYGATSPPAKEPGHASFEASHTYMTPGTYEVYISGQSNGTGLCEEPYQSTADTTLTVVIQ